MEDNLPDEETLGPGASVDSLEDFFSARDDMVNMMFTSTIGSQMVRTRCRLCMFRSFSTVGIFFPSWSGPGRVSILTVMSKFDSHLSA